MLLYFAINKVTDDPIIAPHEMSGTEAEATALPGLAPQVCYPFAPWWGSLRSTRIRSDCKCCCSDKAFPPSVSNYPRFSPFLVHTLFVEVLLVESLSEWSAKNFPYREQLSGSEHRSEEQYRAMATQSRAPSISLRS